MKKRSVALLIALLAVAAMTFFAVSCGGGDDGDDGGGEEEAKVFKIGYSADLSGGYSSYDVPIRDGAQYAIDKINEAGGVAGMKLEMIVKDNKNDKALAVQTTQELIDEGIQYLIGTTSDHVVACNRLAQDNEIPSDTGDGTAPNLVDDIGEWSFQYIMQDNLQGAAMAEYCYGELGYRTAYLLKSPDVPYSNNLPLYFKDVFEKLGGEVVGISDYKLEAGDFSAQVTKIANASPKPDMIYTPMFMPDTPVFLKQLKAAGVDIPVVSSDGNDTPDILSAGPEALDGMILTTFAFPEPDTPLYDFYQQFEQDKGSPPETVIVANGYDGILILQAALEQTGGKGGQALRDALSELSGIKIATTDDYVMDPNSRRAEREIALLEMKGDEFTFVQYLPFPQYVPAPL
ncbi:MAG: ABC transporter substrate-binding protein [Actinobacteria bacterium]|nr:ABC transporter substrate-binding protein [Actinomycetota bacterium]